MISKLSGKVRRRVETVFYFGVMAVVLLCVTVVPPVLSKIPGADAIFLTSFGAMVGMFYGIFVCWWMQR